MDEPQNLLNTDRNEWDVNERLQIILQSVNQHGKHVAAEATRRIAEIKRESDARREKLRRACEIAVDEIDPGGVVFAQTLDKVLLELYGDDGAAEGEANV